jgi:hypothetical protein
LSRHRPARLVAARSSQDRFQHSLHGSGAFRTDKFGKLAEQGTFGVQAGPGNDIHAGSPGLQKAPKRGSASLVAIRASLARVVLGASIARGTEGLQTRRGGRWIRTLGPASHTHRFGTPSCRLRDGPVRQIGHHPFATGYRAFEARFRRRVYQAIAWGLSAGALPTPARERSPPIGLWDLAGEVVRARDDHCSGFTVAPPKPC